MGWFIVTNVFDTIDHRNALSKARRYVTTVYGLVESILEHPLFITPLPELEVSLDITRKSLRAWIWQ